MNIAFIATGKQYEEVKKYAKSTDKKFWKSIKKGMEIDIFAAGANEIWLAESKWQDKKVGIDVIHHQWK